MGGNVRLAPDTRRGGGLLGGEQVRDVADRKGRLDRVSISHPRQSLTARRGTGAHARHAERVDWAREEEIE